MTLPHAAIAAISASDVTAPASPALSRTAPEAFGQLLLGGVEKTDRTITQAEKLGAQFALDDSVPVHQVTFALQEARLSLEFMLQVRSRLLEAYQQFANLQI